MSYLQENVVDIVCSNILYILRVCGGGCVYVVLKMCLCSPKMVSAAACTYLVGIILMQGFTLGRFQTGWPAGPRRFRYRPLV